jgi:hypothetical protein
MRGLALLSLLLLCPVPGWAQAAAVRGIVHDPNHRPIPGAVVSLRNLAAAASAVPRRAHTNANGEFAFAGIAAGNYLITAQVGGFRPVIETVAVTAAASPILHLLLHPAAATQVVTVTAKAERLNAQTSTTQTAVSGRQIARTPGADQANSSSMITDYLPGATVVHDMLHVRGGHQESWFVDGIPVLNTNIASNVGPAVAPGNIDQLQMQTGGYSAEYGDRTYGFFNAITPSGFSDTNQAQLIASYGNYRQTNDQLSLASHTDRFAYYTSLNGNFSNLGLNPPEAQPFHDNAAGLGGMASALFNASAHNQFRFLASLRGDTYQIPNTAAAQTAGIRDLDRERDGLVGMTWSHVTGNGGLLTVTPFYHYNRADYVGGPNDTPFVLNDNRRSQYYGVMTGATLPLGGANTLNTGLFVWRQHDSTRFALTANPVVPGVPASADVAEAPSATAEDPYIEDTDKPFAWLTLDAGLRYSHYSGLIAEHATDPRLSAAIELPKVHWTLHGYYARYYQEPPLDTVSGPLLSFALQQGYGFTPLHGERDRQWDAGLAIPFHGWVLNFDHFRTDAANFLDHDEIGNSDIFLPLADASARIQGNETSLSSPVLQWGGRLTLTWSNQIALAAGPVTGGLLEFAPTGYFYLDHDQRNTFHAVYSTSLPGHSWASGVYSFGSGFLNGNGPAHLPPHSTVGVSLGRRFGERLSLSLNATNLLNSSFLIDNSNTFGGTHWQYPRQVYVELRYRFHY